MKGIMYCILAGMACLMLSTFAEAQENGRLSTHILDISKGAPAANVPIHLFRDGSGNGEWVSVSTRKTDANGRISNFLPSDAKDGIYKLRFETAPYFKAMNQPSIYPYIEVVFSLEGDGHFHIPITLSANGYSTYRGN